MKKKSNIVVIAENSPSSVGIVPLRAFSLKELEERRDVSRWGGGANGEMK